MFKKKEKPIAELIIHGYQKMTAREKESITNILKHRLEDWTEICERLKTHRKNKKRIKFIFMPPTVIEDYTTTEPVSWTDL